MLDNNLHKKANQSANKSKILATKQHNKKAEDEEDEGTYQGWLVIDKPKDMTSADVIRELKRLVGKAKMGHAGTLDPMATGVLPVAFGKATKMMPFLSDTTKEYQFTIKWGQATDTCDADGKVTYMSDKRPSLSEIKEVLPLFMGKSQQTPPSYSAVKIQGKKAYELARQGKEVEITPREVTIESLEVIADIENETSCDYTSFSVVCSQGTYVRSLAKDLALKLGTYGHITYLRRLRSGKFKIQDAILLEKLKEIEHLTVDSSLFLPSDTVLDDISVLALSEVEARTIVSGNPISALPLLKRNNAVVGDSLVFRMEYKGKLLALAHLQGAAFRPMRVLVNFIEGDDDVDYS